ncbi:hypothetical protein BLOT_009977 [Blomia tropicalis]|nr:hypothetical protein BLOT_009977 [Blomia tropicalis]
MLPLRFGTLGAIDGAPSQPTCRWTVHREESIRVGQSYVKPDLIAVNQETHVDPGFERSHII